MKALKVFFGVMIGAVALVLAASPAAAQAGPVPTPQPNQSDFLQLNDSTGTQIGFVAATEAIESNTALFQFDHQLSNPMEMGHLIEVLDSAGNISDVVGVASSDGTLNAGTNVFAFMSEKEGSGGLTNAQIAMWFGAGFVIDETLTETQNGIFIDSATDTFLASYINPTNAPGGRAFFFSDGFPDGGSALALLGMALTGIEFVRRKFRKA